MFRKLFNVLTIVALLMGFVAVGPATAMEDSESNGPIGGQPETQVPLHQSSFPKGIKDQPNTKDYLRAQQRMQLVKEGNLAEASALDQTGTDRVLVILVEFAGTDTFTWTAGTSHWDPFNIADPAQSAGAGNCSKIITTTQTFTYTGPLHNEIERPLSEADRSGQSIWTEDFNPQWFNDFMFGNGVTISYTRQDASQAYANFQGKSVKDFYSDLSNGAYTINGDVIGWLQVPHSTMYYDADQCPGARSTDGTYSVGRGGYIDGAGDARDLVKDALDATNAISNTIPGFSWANYDKNGDKKIDRLWIVHAGYGEEDSTTLLNRTAYGESAVWSHSSAVTPAYPVGGGISAGPYIVMPENGGIGVFAHEYAHNLGAMDLYAYDQGETSAGFWTTMADDWTGYPIGFEPPAQDPMHLDWWGWLDPLVVTDTSKVYEATIGQASRFPGGTDMVRGVKIELPTQVFTLPISVWDGNYYWWGGKGDVMNSKMTTVSPIDLTGTTAPQLSFDLDLDIENQWDYMWVQVSTNGTDWEFITNTNQTCTHVSGWIGGEYPELSGDLCARGIYGFTGNNTSWPDPDNQVFDLSKYIGSSIKLRLWYMTDWGTTYDGVFVDNFAVTDGATTLFSDDAEASGANWTYEPKWIRSNGTQEISQRYYLQWRNVNKNGGYDEALGDARWRYGPANTGLLVWYENEAYTDNEIWSYLENSPSWGPKGRMLVVDANNNPPYRDPWMVAKGYDNEGGNAVDRSQMRDAPFTLADTVDFTMQNTYPYTNVVLTADYSGLPAANVFHDALGYFPGAEFVSRGPGYLPPSIKWVTKQWDASTVLPSKVDYPLNAPGYLGTGGTGDQEFRFNCASTNTGRLGCYWYGGLTGLGYDGGNGNPADVDGQYGWHVELVQEANDHTWGKVRIWNSPYAVDSVLTPDETHVAVDDAIDYNATFKNAGSLMSYMACVEFDSTKLEYVPDSASETPLLLESCPLGAKSLSPTAGVVGALAWTVYDAEPNAKAEFTFQLKAIENGQFIQPTATILPLLEGSTLYTSLTSPFLTIGEWLFLPAVQK